MKNWLTQFKNYIEISNFERRGVFTLLFFILLFLGYHYYRANYNFGAPEFDEAKIAALHAHLDTVLVDHPKASFTSNYSTAKKKVQTEVTAFNPNTFSYNQLVESGVPKKIAKNILNYRNGGGQFKSKADLKKLYAVSDSEFQMIKDFAVIEYQEQEEKTFAKAYDSKRFKEEQAVVVEINSATVEDLKKVPGIGEYYAGKIVKHRNKLGGFYSLDQVKELYVNRPENFEKIQTHLTLNASLVKRINLNTASFDVLRQHPMLTYNQARAIVNYRKQHHRIEDTEQLKSLHIFKDKDISTLLQYVSLNEE